MPVIENIDELTHAEKLEAIGELEISVWKDQRDGVAEDPPWVAEILAERMKMLESGDAKLLSWEEVRDTSVGIKVLEKR